jgi:hypothetical protein
VSTSTTNAEQRRRRPLKGVKTLVRREIRVLETLHAPAAGGLFRSGEAVSARGVQKLGRMPDLADWQRDRIHAPHGGRKVFRGVDSLTVPMMGWLRRLFARLRGSRPAAQVTPVPAPEPESTEAQPPTLSYRITVETLGGGEETHHYSRPGLPVTKDESIDLGGGRYVTVLEVVEEAQPGVKDGTIRAKRTPPPPTPST